MCPPNRPFRCKNDRVCLWIGRQCDGTDNCGDGTDEEDCGEQGASKGEPGAPRVGVLHRQWGWAKWAHRPVSRFTRRGEDPEEGRIHCREPGGPVLEGKKPLRKVLRWRLRIWMFNQPPLKLDSQAWDPLYP